MPTQRPFFANFFAAFRARSSPTFQAKSSTTAGAISPSILSASAHVSTTTATVTSTNAPRTITTKNGSDQSPQTTNGSTAQPIKTAGTSPFGTATITSSSPGTAFYRRPPSPGPHSHNLALSPANHTTQMSRGRQRRDSGSSNTSGGFMDAMGSEKWYVGGRTATGEERFYQLGLVSSGDGKRVRSLDRSAHWVMAADEFSGVDLSGYRPSQVTGKFQNEDARSPSQRATKPKADKMRSQECSVEGHSNNYRPKSLTASPIFCSLEPWIMKRSHSQLLTICSCLRTSHSFKQKQPWTRCRTVYDAQSNRSLCAQIHPFHSGSPPQLVYRRPCIACTPARTLSTPGHVRYNTAVAAAPRDLDQEKSAEDRDQEQEQDQDRARETSEPVSTTTRGAVFRNALCDVEFLSINTCVPRIATFLASEAAYMRFEASPVLDPMLPGLAELLGLQHVEPGSSVPRYRSIQQNKMYHLFVKTGNSRQIPQQKLWKLIGRYLERADYSTKYFHWSCTNSEDKNVHASTLIKLLLGACKNRPRALPTIKFTINNDPLEAHLNAEATKTDPCAIHLTNDRYKIHVVRPLDKLCPVSQQTAVVQAIMEYCQTIWTFVRDDDTDNFHFDRGIWSPVDFVQKATRDLRLGAISYNESPLDTHSEQDSFLDLEQTEVWVEHKGCLGRPAVWFDRKQTRLLALLQACVVVQDLLQDAFKRGSITDSQYYQFAKYWEESHPEGETGQEDAQQKHDRSIHKMYVDQQVISTMFAALRTLVQNGFQSTYDWSSAHAVGLDTDPGRYLPLRDSPALNRRLHNRLQTRKSSQTDSGLDLPVLDPEYSLQIQEMVQDSDVTIISASTGSGKTTQVPQLIFDKHIAEMTGSTCSIVCTQPRRVSTISVATRVASERGQEVGQDVGYKVRFDARPTSSNSGITYMTSGYLIRLLELDPLKVLQRYSHIILDEIHTRDADSDMLLTALKNVLGRRVSVSPPTMPKIVLMSATLDAGFFKHYFRDLGPQFKVSSIEVPGRMYPVEVNMLETVLTTLRSTHGPQLRTVQENSRTAAYIKRQEDLGSKPSEEAEDDDTMHSTADEGIENTLSVEGLEVPVNLLHLLVVHLLETTSSGDILVFLPGLSEIDQLEKLLLSDVLSEFMMSDLDRYRIFKLHSALYETNYGVFDEVPDGCRRIVLSTNIAETSITLPNVMHVIDSGLSRQSTYDQVTQSGTFGLRWISKAEVIQRRGRAGRTQPGTYYGIFSQAQHDAMADTQTPELLRTSLDALVLRTAASPAFRVQREKETQDDEAAQLLAGHALLLAPTPPEIKYIEAAAQQLRNIRALDSEGEATTMGKVLSALPVGPAAAKGVLLGLVFRCFDSMMLFGAMRDDLPIMYEPLKTGAIHEKRKQLAGLSDDDKWADLQGFMVFNEARKRRQKFAADDIQEQLSLRYDAYCDQAQISRQTFDMLRPMLALKDDYDDLHDYSYLPKPIFPITPSALNINSKNSNLVKALALSIAGTRLAQWGPKEWRSPQSKVIPSPRSVNHFVHGRRGIMPKARRETGDLITYSNMRHNLKDKYPWLHETSIVSPLAGILFGESVALAEEESTFIINGWIKYEVVPKHGAGDPKIFAKVIWEYRKALDRFFALTMQLISLHPGRLKKVKHGELSFEDFNVFFKEADHPFRSTVVNSVIEILNKDAQDRADRVAARIEDMKESGINFEQRNYNHIRGVQHGRDSASYAPMGSVFEEDRT